MSLASDEAANLHGGTQTLLEVLQDAGLTTNLKLCLDAADGDSYTSGQKWLDRSGNGYDFFLGADNTATTDDPTFTSADEASYFGYDGGDRNKYDTTNETWMNALHKDSAAHSGGALIYFGAVNAAQSIWNTRAGSGDLSGARLFVTSAGKLTYEVVNNAALALSKVSDNALSAATWMYLGWTIDEASNSGFFRLNNGYLQVGASNTFAAAYSSPSANNCQLVMQIGDAPYNGEPLLNGSRLAALHFHQGGILSAANHDTIFTGLRARFAL